MYAFAVIRKFNHSQDGKTNTFNVTTVLQINSPELIAVGQDVIGHVQGISWTAKPLRVRVAVAPLSPLFCPLAFCRTPKMLKLYLIPLD